MDENFKEKAKSAENVTELQRQGVEQNLNTLSQDEDVLQSNESSPSKDIEQSDDALAVSSTKIHSKQDKKSRKFKEKTKANKSKDEEQNIADQTATDKTIDESSHGTEPTKRKSRDTYAVKMLGKSMLDKLKEAMASVLPVAVIVLILLLVFLKEFSTKEIVTFVISAVFLIIGISFFNLGADLAMTPMGEHVGEGLTKSRKLWLLLLIAFAMGVLITIAEPDLSVLAEQVGTVMNNVLLIVTVGGGVGIFLVIAIARIVFKKDLSYLLIFFYMVLFALCALLIERGKSGYVPLVFDSGGVTTGPVTVPFIMALGIGVAGTVGGRNAKENSFGLIALSSIGPMLAVLVLSLFTKGNMQYELSNFSVEESLSNVGGLLAGTLKEVAIALGLIVLFFVVLQLVILKLPKRKTIQIAIGIVYTFLGLVIFLTAVKIGFMPIGFKLGQTLANANKYALIAFAFVIGCVVVLAEPAVHVLNRQVEEISGGAVSKRSMLIALSIGVGISIGLSVIRLIYGFSLLYYIIPGYLISLGLSIFVPKLYTAIAFDSGGVASGPLASSFILPLAIGACTALRGENEVLDFAFGIVAMVAMTPLITIQLLGFRATTAEKVRSRIVLKRIIDADDEQIIDFM